MSDSSQLADLGEIAIDQNLSFSQLLTECGLEAIPYAAVPNATPLCFIHVARTAGASVIAWLESMFEKAQCAPCRTDYEFDELRALGSRYRLHAGHILGWQLDLLPEGTQLFTILRHPIDRAISLYYWVLHHLPDAIAGDPFKREVPPLAVAGQLFRTREPPDAISAEIPIARLLFRNSLISQLGATREEWGRAPLLASNSRTLHEFQQNQWVRAVELLNRISIVGDYVNLIDALLLLSATRGWPAPPTLPRFHDINAPTAAPAPDVFRERLERISSADFRFYRLAQRRSTCVLSKVCELSGAPTREAVDAHHIKCFFEAARPVIGFDIRASSPWNGRGWGVCVTDVHGHKYREIDDGCSASTLVALDPSVAAYRLFVHIFQSDPEIAVGLAAYAGGMPLGPGRLTTRSGALIKEWRVPGEIIRASDGKMEFMFRTVAKVGREQLTLARIGCVPAPGEMPGATAGMLPRVRTLQTAPNSDGAPVSIGRSDFTQRKAVVNDLEKHLALFRDFPPFSGFVPQGFVADFLGGLTDAKFRAMFGINPDKVLGGHVTTSRPDVTWGEGFFEAVDWFEAAREARGTYTMLTLGACYGSQAVGAYLALQRLNPMPCRLVAVEPEPGNFEWLKKNFRDNKIDPDQHWLINCALSDSNKPVLFPIGASGAGFNNCIGTNDQSVRRAFAERLRTHPDLPNLVYDLIVECKTGIEVTQVQGANFKTHADFVSAVTLNDVLAPLDSVDLLEADLQQSEVVVFPPAMDRINAKVKRVHIGTHGVDIHEKMLRELVDRDFEIVFNYLPHSHHDTQFGSFDINDGIITARNPRLLPPR